MTPRHQAVLPAAAAAQTQAFQLTGRHLAVLSIAVAQAQGFLVTLLQCRFQQLAFGQQQL